MTAAAQAATRQRWLAAAGPWRGFLNCPVLLFPGVEDLTAPPAPSRPNASQTARQPAAPRAATLARSLAAELAAGGVLCVLDLDPLVGIPIAAALRRAEAANVVILIPRWPYPEAILPVAPLLAALTAHARHLPADARRLPSVVFVLDHQRSRPVHRPAADRRADNRYALGPADLPDLATLRARGIRRVLKLTSA